MFGELISAFPCSRGERSRLPQCVPTMLGCMPRTMLLPAHSACGHGSSRTTLTMKNPPQLLRGDWPLLMGFGIALFLMTLITQPPISDLSARQLQSVREMSVSGDWLVPTVGGAPELDRTPVAQWAVLVAMKMGLPSIVAARWVTSMALSLTACLIASVGAQIFGRRVGLLAGLMTLTSSSLLELVGSGLAEPVAAIGIVLAIVAAIQADRADDAATVKAVRFPASVVSNRPFSVWLLFGALAFAAFCNGWLIVSVMVLAPLGFYVGSGKQTTELRSAVWLWGWLAVGLAGSVWPMLVWQRFPEVGALWSVGSLSEWLAYLDVDRLRNRIAQGGLTAMNLAATWGVVVPVGMWWLRHDALGNRRSSERLVWTVASIGPIAAIVLCEHPRPLLLSSLVWWNLIAAVGLERTVAAAIGMLRDWAMQQKLRVTVPLIPINRPVLAMAFGCFLLGFGPLLWSDVFGTRTGTSMQLLAEVLNRNIAGDELVVVDMELGDDSSVALYELGDRAWPAHNLSYLLDDSLPSPEVLVVTRGTASGSLSCLGEVSDVIEVTGNESLSVFRLRLSPDLVRFHRDNVRMTLAQSLHAEPGPWPLGIEISSRTDQSRKPATMVATESTDPVRR